MSEIEAVLVPSWGLTMEEGKLVEWLAELGSSVRPGDALVDIETTKITNTLEASVGGVLRRRIGEIGETYACGTLIAVIADPDVGDEEIDTFVSKYEVIAKPADAETPQRYLDLQGKQLCYVMTGSGDGTPVLFIHGLAGALNNWMLVQPSLAEDRPTVAIDLPGHGASYKDVSQISSFDDVADILGVALDRLEIPTAHIVAHSMGAQVALAMARGTPERVASLTLLAPAGMGHAVNPAFIEGLISAKARRQVSEVLSLLFASGDVSRDMAEEMLRYKRLDGVEAALGLYARLLREAEGATQALAGLSQPYAIVWGADDRIIAPVDEGDLKPGVDLVLLEVTGHMPHLEQSAKTADTIKTLIARSEGA